MKNVLFVLVLGLMTITGYGRGVPPTTELNHFIQKSAGKEIVQRCTVNPIFIENFKVYAAEISLVSEQIVFVTPYFPVPKGCRSEVSPEPTFRMALYRHGINTSFLYKNDSHVLPVLRLPDGRVMNC